MCGSPGVTEFALVHGRRFGDCQVCGLLHLWPEQRFGRAEERAHYSTHRNDPVDLAYRAFLSRLSNPLVTRLPEGAEGLDYGSGPGPTLSGMLEEQGFSVRLYDPFFAPNPRALERTYDFVVCSETVEHFFRPGFEFDRLNRLLRPTGWLGVMTEIYRNQRPFEEWRYAREDTHVCFYRPETMTWIARRFGWSCVTPHPNVVLFQKPG
jgi:SAM-dependent methyltransferase